MVINSQCLYSQTSKMISAYMWSSLYQWQELFFTIFSFLKVESTGRLGSWTYTATETWNSSSYILQSKTFTTASKNTPSSSFWYSNLSQSVSFSLSVPSPSFTYFPLSIYFMYACLHASWYPCKAKEGVGSLRGAITDKCELPNMSARIDFRSSGRAARSLNCWAINPDPHLFLFWYGSVS